MNDDIDGLSVFIGMLVMAGLSVILFVFWNNAVSHPSDAINCVKYFELPVDICWAIIDGRQPREEILAMWHEFLTGR